MKIRKREALLSDPGRRTCEQKKKKTSYWSGGNRPRKVFLPARGEKGEFLYHDKAIGSHKLPQSRVGKSVQPLRY